MIALQPGYEALRKLLRVSCPDVVDAAVERWEIADASPVEVRPAKALPGQIDRIRGAQFGSLAEVVRDLTGGFASLQAPTLAYRLKDVLLLDGVLYTGNAVRHLKHDAGRKFLTQGIPEFSHGSLYESWPGNRWFGNWLCDDTLAYRLAEGTGRPVTTQPASGHKRDYSDRLAITPTRVSNARFAELFIFEDRPHNEGKRQRADAIRRRLAPVEPSSHAGVFLMRGNTGEKRALLNEAAVADRLAKRGFTIVDPLAYSVEQLIAICAGADVVAGVEGSQLVHGLMVMPPRARALVIQPPTRAVSVLKLITDRQRQDFAYLVGEGDDEGFTVDLDELDRTLDLA